MKSSKTFATLAKLMRADADGRLSDGEFDDNLWLLLFDHIRSPADAAGLGEPVLVYFASHYMQWEVGNGGFEQAAYNIPEWFEPAPLAYRKLGLEQAASLIDEAALLMQRGERRGKRFVDAPGSQDDPNERLAQLFQQFAESELSTLDKRVEGAGLWANESRLRYVRRNREAFEAIH